MRRSPHAPRPVALAAGLVVAAAVTASAGAGTAEAASAGSGAAAAGARVAQPQSPAVDRTVQDREVSEISGMVASVRHPGSLWVHQDSGHPGRLYAIDRAGQTRATVSVRNAEAVDWEAMTMTRDGSGRRVLAIGDIGDNSASRPELEILVVREPGRLRDTSVSPVRRIRVRYPGSASDAEALLSDPRTGRLYIVTKSLVGAELFVVPQAAWPGTGPDSRLWTLEPVARPETSVVTDGTFLPDGRMLLRNYGSMTVFPPPVATPSGSVRSLASTSLPDQEQGEALALTPDGRTALLGSEGVRQPILRVPVPATPVAQVSASPTSSLVGAQTGQTRQVTKVDDRGAEKDTVLPSVFVLVMLIALGVLMLLFTVVALALR